MGRGIMQEGLEVKEVLRHKKREEEGKVLNNKDPKLVAGTHRCSACLREDLCDDDFYVFPENGRRHKTCIRCSARRKRSAVYCKENPIKRKLYDRKSRDGVRRDTEQNFYLYMAENPEYFQDVFGYPATNENIFKAAVVMCRNGI